MVRQENGILQIYSTLNGEEIVLFERKIAPRQPLRVDDHTIVNPWHSAEGALPHMPDDMYSEKVLVETENGYAVAHMWAWDDDDHLMSAEDGLEFEPTFETDGDKDPHIRLDEVVAWQYIFGRKEQQHAKI